MRLSINTFLLFAGSLLAGCSKGVTTTPASTNVMAPQTLTQMEGLLNDINLFSQTPVKGEQSADSYLLTDPSSASLSAIDLNLYVWKPDIYGGATNSEDWNVPYRQIAVCNEVLQDLPQITRGPENMDRWDAAAGKARFLRSYAFLQLLMLYSPAYTGANADLLQGIPLPLQPDLHAVYTRASLRDCYSQVTTDLQKATRLLQVRGVDSSYPKPDKAAACALLARTYHLMGDYSNARLWADSALLFAPPLVNYKNIGSTKPSTALATEVLYATSLMTSNVLQAGLPVCVITPALYQSYEDSDRRKTLFFRIISGQPYYRNCYGSGFLPFSGIATDEVYLIRAECFAQTGDVARCLADVDTLLSYRCFPFTPHTSLSQQAALQLVWKEQEKEWLFRGLRWAQLKRLNAAGANLALRRSLNGQTYDLAPNDKKYVLPVPASALSGNAITQWARD